MFIRCIVYMIALVCASVTMAADFGIQGHTYPVIEEDMLEVIKKRLITVDQDKLNKKMQEKTKSYVERPTPPKNITTAKENKEFYYDPTYIVPDDIYDDKNKLIKAKGTKINPLMHVGLNYPLMFIDADEQRQVELALKLYKAKEGKLKIVLVKGAPLEIQRKHKIWIYFDQAGIITTKLGITEVPALVQQDGLTLKIQVMGGDLGA